MTDRAGVWIITVDVPPAVAERCERVLDGGERARAAAFLSGRDRQRFIIAHGALRIVVASELRARPAALRWTLGPHGKPELAGFGLHTSLSHSGDLIAVAISAGRQVGVDIQHVDPGLDTVGLSGRFFPPDEFQYVAAGQNASARADRFAHLWVRKEAVVKASGGRIWANLNVAVLERAVVTSAELCKPHRVADVAVPRGFRCAVALTGAAPFVTKAVGWPC